MPNKAVLRIDLGKEREGKGRKKKVLLSALKKIRWRRK